MAVSYQASCHLDSSSKLRGRQITTLNKNVGFVHYNYTSKHMENKTIQSDTI